MGRVIARRVIVIMKSPGHIVILVLTVVALATAEIRNKGWWKHTVFYQIYPRSFMDSNADGVGDLSGINSKMQHFKDAGIGAIWLSPIYKSPMKDFGYDISDFKAIDEVFGNLEDLKKIIATAKTLGLKVILDLVPNHTSDQHDWFKQSRNKVEKYIDYYVWNNGKKLENGTVVAPNNWLSVFNGSGWTLDTTRNQYFFHQFLPEQPDLNYANTAVQQEMLDVMTYWLDLGVDGFRIDAVPHLFEGDITQDEPPSNVVGAKPNEHIYLSHTLTKDQPETYALIKTWRQHVDKYANDKNEDEKVLMTEAYTSLKNTLKYYETGANVPFNFKFITDTNARSTATNFKEIIDNWMAGVPQDGVANWVMGNHDRTRIGTRYPGRADQMTMLAMILPGVAVTYYGEELGMVDYIAMTLADFRDGCRTPFQWDNTTNAGFTTGPTTWLPVNPNYKTLNLAYEKVDSDSHYKLYTGLTSLRTSSDALQNGDLKTEVLNNEVLAVVRRASNQTVALLINFSDQNNITVNLANLASNWNNPMIKLSNVGSGLKPNTLVNINAVTVPAKVSVILISPGSVPEPIAPPSKGIASSMSLSVTCLLWVTFLMFQT